MKKNQISTTPTFADIKPVFNRGRKHSWSEMSSFYYDKEQWWTKYCLHGPCTRAKDDSPPFCVITRKCDPECPQITTSIQMLFGNYIGNKIATDPTFLPEVPRYEIFEQEFTAVIPGSDIQITGFLDSFRVSPVSMREYKTSSNPKKWTYKSASNHGQMKFYKLLIALNMPLSFDPGQIFSTLTYIPVKMVGNLKGFHMELSNEPIQTWEVRHTAHEVWDFANEILETMDAMEAYAIAHRVIRLSTPAALDS